MVRQSPATLVRNSKLKFFLPVFAVLALIGPATAQETITRGGNMSVDAALDGRLAIDLRDSIWILPEDGGQAELITAIKSPARQPRWSPLDDSILYQTTIDGLDQIQLYRFAGNLVSAIGDPQFLNQHPAWHPLGERIVFSSDRHQSGFDLWEYDLQTGLSWRISHRAGDELEPAWSSDGRDLVYVHQENNVWSIMLRRFGMPERALATSSFRMSAPQWRPDGSLITYRQEHESGSTIEMIILSDPLLIRPLVSGEDFGSAPVSWLDRQQLLYTASGGIRRRNFNSWSSVNVPFRATLLAPEEDIVEQPQRLLSSFDLPNGQIVIRAARLFDGIGGGYREHLDVLIDGGKIVALEPRQDRPGQVIVDLGAVTVLPGFIDSYSALPQDFDDSYGALLLSFGVTTIVADYPLAADLDQRWSGKSTPGPRIFNSGSEELVASLLHGTSSVADANTPGLAELLRVRQSSLLPAIVPRRRFSEPPNLEGKATSVVAGSKPNGLHPGMALHAEFLALSAAGLNGEQVLRSAGVNAATYLKFGLQLGRIAPGSRADLVIVDGDPLQNVADLRKVVGVVRNGRFFSAIGLIERVTATIVVE
jgi:hypothetical protein